jgi:hypothetical protein
MDDEELKQAFARIEQGQKLMMTQINDQFERVLDQMAGVRSDVDTMGGHLLHAMEDRLTLSRRVTRLEEDMRRLRKD